MAVESDQGKLFIGGISWETTEEKLKDYFSAYGEVVEAVIMKDRATGRARGFGFIVFADPFVADSVILEKHSIDGRMVEAKKAVPRDDQHGANRISNGSVSSPVTSNPTKTKKIFVGGLASTVTEGDFKKYFGQFGTITDVVVMYDHGTHRPRGFGFITYDSEESVDRVLQKTFHELNDKMVEVKRAVPKELSAGPARSNGIASPGSRGSPYAGSYTQTFSTSTLIPYASLIESRYGSSPSNRAPYHPYGTIGHANSRIQSGLLSGAYNSSLYGRSSSYGSVGYGSNMQGSSASGTGFGSTTNSSSVSNPYNSSLARNYWGNGGARSENLNESTVFEDSGAPGLSIYGRLGTWGSSQTWNNKNSMYDSQAFINEGSDSVWSSSNSAGFGAQGIGQESSLRAFGLCRTDLESGSQVRDIYHASAFNDLTWRATPADKFRSATSGFGGLGNGVYGLPRSPDNSNKDGVTVDTEYSALGRQLFRDVPV